MPMTINITKAKTITKDRLRVERKPLLEAQDILFNKANSAHRQEFNIALDKEDKRTIFLVLYDKGDGMVVEFDEDQPDIRKQGRINDGRRMYAEGAQDESRYPGSRSGGLRDLSHDGQHARGERAPRRDFNRPAPTSRDPFFDKPYEPTPVAEEGTPSWEASAKATAPRSVSANIKSKRRVAALFRAAPEVTSAA